MLKKSQLKPKIFARIFSDAGVHVCDTEPEEVEQICELVDTINKRVKKEIRFNIVNGDIVILTNHGYKIAGIKMLPDRDMVIFLRNAINNKCRGLRAVSQVQGGMRYDIGKENEL